jgi:hypothetical protein
MRLRKPINIRTYFRAIVAVAMMLVWSLVTISGFLLWSVPHGPCSSAQILLLNLTKREWANCMSGSVSSQIGITFVHLVIDWRALCGCVKYLASVHRVGGPANDQPVNSTPVREVA